MKTLNLNTEIHMTLRMVFLFFFLSLIGCKKDIDSIDVLKINENNPTVNADGGVLQLKIESNATWKVGEISSDWISIENEAGNGDGDITINYEENKDIKSREVEFFIVTTQGGVYEKVLLTQLSSQPFIEISEEEKEVVSRPRKHTVTVNSNIPASSMEIEVVYDDENDEGWIIGSKVDNEELTFQTALNSKNDVRKAHIILSFEDTESETEVWDIVQIFQMDASNDLPPEETEFTYVKELPLGEIEENISIKGTVVSDGTSDNFRKKTYIIQNEEGLSFAFEGNESLALNKYDEIELLLDGVEISTFEETGERYNILKGINNTSIINSQSNTDFAPKEMYISELTDDYLLSLITLKDVEFAIPHGGFTNFHEYYVTQSYGDHATKHYPAPIRDINGNNMYLITNREVTYRRNSVPKGSGTLTGLVVKIRGSAYGDLGEYSIRHLEESDIAINPDRTNGFSDILVEWELEPTTGFPDGTSNLPPTTGSENATLQKDGGTGFYAANTLNGIYLIDKYRGDKTGANTIISNSLYNVNSWGTGRYWIMDNVSTLGITSSLSLQFEAVSISSTGTGGGPRDFVVEYSLDGENWNRIANYQLTGQIAVNQVQNVTPGLKMFTYSLPDELLDQPSIKIRLMNINDTSVNGGSIAIPGSTSRLGHFSIKYNK